MLMRFDPFRDLDRLSQEALSGFTGRSTVMALDAYKHEDAWTVSIDLPGFDPSNIDLTVDRNVLTVQATRDWSTGEGDKVLTAERPRGTFTRQLMLGEQVDSSRIQAHYVNGVLEVTLPVTESAKPRRVAINTAAPEGGQPSISVDSSEREPVSSGV